MRRLLVSLALCLALPVLAAEHRSVNVPAAIMFDAPSDKAKKLYLIKAGTPVEVVVKLDGWLKVRDAEGGLAWVAGTQLAERRTLIVTAPSAELRQADSDNAGLLRRVEKWVVLDYAGPAAPGWVRVSHPDAGSAFVRASQVWGL